MKLRLLNTLACIGAFAALCLNSAPVEAIFASVKATGMAATCISYPLDSLVGAYNPAGITDVGDRFDVEAAWVQDWGKSKVSGNRTATGALNPLTNGSRNGMRTKTVYPAGFGLTKGWCLANDWEVSAGLILYNRNYQKTTYKHALALFGRSPAGLEYLNETVAPIVAVKWCDRHSIGISVNYQIERLKVNGLQNFDNTLFSSAPGHVTNRGYEYATGWGVTIGYLGKLTDSLSIGVTYQPETGMTRLNKYKGFLADRGRLNIPRKIGAGISYHITPCLVVAFDVEHIQWSKIRSLHNPLLHNGVLEKLGQKNGPGFGFRNQWYYRVGSEWRINESWTVRAGYRYANTPIRRSQTAVNVLTLDTVESFVTVGGTWNLNECNEFTITYAYGFEHKIRGRNAIPAFLGGGNVDLKEQKYALGIAWGYNF
jgi:long-chain fatty acid transport protein